MPRNRILAPLGLALLVASWAIAQDPLGINPQANVAKAPAPEAEAPPTAAEKTIDDAIAKLRGVASASAKVSMLADMLNQKIRLDGDYKKAPGNRVFLLLTLLGSADASDRMLQVCDGVTSYEFIKVLDSQNCTKRTIKPILEAINKPDCDPKMREQVLHGLGLAGPEALLSGLRQSFAFDQSREEDLDGRPMIVLRGSWKDGKSPIMPTGQPVGPSGPLPPYVPSLVILYLGKEDNWPYKVVFEGRLPAMIEQRRKPEEATLDPTGRAQSRKLVAPSARPTRMTLTYTDVQIGATIPDETFAFTPPETAKISDETETLVQTLNQVIEASAEKRRTQAASPKGDPVLDGGVTAPAPSGGEGGSTKKP